MTLRVNKELTGLENLYKLVQHTWPEQADVLVPENVEVQNLADADNGTHLQVDLVGVSEGVVGTKTVTYVAANLESALEDVAADTVEDAVLQVEAQIAELPCLTSEIEVDEPLQTEDGFTLRVDSVEGAYTVFGSKDIVITINEYPFNLETDLEGTELDGFGQVVPVVRSVELPEGGDVVLAEGDTFQYGVNFDGDEVAALELDIIIADPVAPLNAKEQFTVYADADNPYGNDSEKFAAMGVSVAYAEGSWSIDFGPIVTPAMAESGEVKIYAALRADDKSKLWGDMMAPTAEMVRKFNISVE